MSYMYYSFDIFFIIIHLFLIINFIIQSILGITEIALNA